MIEFNVSDYFKMQSIVLLLACILCACGGVKIESNKTKGVDLKRYKTYAWGKPGNPESDPNAENRKEDKKMYGGLILRLANEELLKKGFVLDTLNPDAIFVWNSRSEQRVTYSKGNVENGYGYYSYGYYGGGYYTPVGTGRSSHRAYEEGLLYIDMLDTKTKTPLWGGWAKKELKAKSDVEADVRSAVKLIFKRLPVQHK